MLDHCHPPLSSLTTEYRSTSSQGWSVQVSLHPLQFGILRRKTLLHKEKERKKKKIERENEKRGQS